jgi:malate dehydrogenase (oxaloacetate-decarboxylating)(NADP+)
MNLMKMRENGWVAPESFWLPSLSTLVDQVIIIRRWIDISYVNALMYLNFSIPSTEILNNPLFNKSTAFKGGERDRLRFRGLLPPRRLNMKVQKQRILEEIRAEDSMIRKNMILEEVHDRNETLYHRILVDHIEEMAPIIYTPTVGQACKEFGMRFRRPRGMYFCEEDRGHMAAMVYNWPQKDVHVIVVTDGSRILGLGDLGANGMGIPIGKLSLYCAAGGIAPHRVMPVVLDVGTNNEELIKDPFYLGMQRPRLQGTKYYHLVDEFIQAVRHRWPNVLIQFEDFSSDKAQVSFTVSCNCNRFHQTAS